MKPTTLQITDQVSRSTWYLGLDDYRLPSRVRRHHPPVPTDCPPFSDPPPLQFSSNGARKSTRCRPHKYEICLGYPCYELVLHDRRVCVYSLQKNKDVLSELVNSATTTATGNAPRLRNGFGPDTPKSPPPSSGQGAVAAGVTTTASAGYASPQHRPSNASSTATSRRSFSPESPNPALPISETAASQVARAGWVFRTLLLARTPGILRDRKSSSGRVLRRCGAGSELVDWLLSQSPVVHNRSQAVAMWQAMLEEGVIAHVSQEQPFKDKLLLYRFWQDEEGLCPPPLPGEEDVAQAEDELKEALGTLSQRAPDAMMRMILRKPTHERTPDDLETIYEELLHIKALSHLSNSVKRELAAVIVFEAHPRAGTVLFHQGDEGRSWYIILRGSVNVVIHGKGTVTTLQEGDDFGKLALINDAPRAATIVLRENNCHFLRVDKDNFNRILRDVEANTVRLKEHGRDVLVLEKISPSASTISHFKYTVMAGTPQKMLEHLLETRLDGRGGAGRDELPSDPFLDDFLLTHIVFMPAHQLVTELARQYPFLFKHIIETEKNAEHKFKLDSCKRRVVHFVHRWVVAIRHPVFDDPSALAFLEELAAEVEADCTKWQSSLRDEAGLMQHVIDQLRRYMQQRDACAGQKWKLPPCGQPISLFGKDAAGAPTTNPADEGEVQGRSMIRPEDDIIFRVYCADHTYCTLRFPMCATAETIKYSAADKLALKHDDLVLVEVKSSGERVVFKDSDVSIPTGLSLNGRIFISPKDHLDALTSLPEQEGPTEGLTMDLELFSTKELAYHMTLFDWDLFWCVHEYELIYHTFGRHHFRKITANLDVFLRRFNEIQFWVVTELCLTTSLSRRVQLLRKFIKLAAYCKEYQNLNAFCAIVMGLSNVAVSRLSLTWEKVPSKARKMFTEFESLIDPSRNHRAYRIVVGKLQAPVVPFMPLLLKDMTFTHEGNKTCLDGLVNFEKMHMLAQTMRTIRYCRNRQLDNQRVLTSLSQKLEPRRS
ncbi:hypothetical protein B566_EDAN003636 [Ephemera danica]|nr:hypothetical protein B566_EDAN003636 [Ephemera danica]